MPGPWIKLDKGITEHAIAQDFGLFHLWVHLLLWAAHKDHSGLAPKSMEQITIKRGTLVTTIPDLHKRLYGKHKSAPVKVGQFRNWLHTLQSMGSIGVEIIAHRYSIITVCNYDVYQSGVTGKLNGDCTATERRLNTEANVTFYKNEELREGKEGATAKIDDPVNPSHDSDDELSPEWLGRRWIFCRKGNQGRSELIAATSTFAEMIRLGCDPSKISRELDNPQRRRTEPIWEFEKRIMAEVGPAAAGAKPGLFDSLKRFAERGGGSDAAI